MENASTLVNIRSHHFASKEAGTLHAELREHFVRYETSVVFDLSQVRQMNTAGVDSLLQCMNYVIKQDGSVRLSEVSPEASTILELIRMDRIFDMFPRFSEETESYTEKTFEETLEGERSPMQSEATPQ